MEVKAKIDARNSLESYTHSMASQVSDKDKLAEKLADDDKATIEEALSTATEWLKENGYESDATKEDFDDQLKTLQDVCNPIVSQLYGKNGQGQQEEDEEFDM